MGRNRTPHSCLKPRKTLCLPEAMAPKWEGNDAYCKPYKLICLDTPHPEPQHLFNITAPWMLAWALYLHLHIRYRQGFRIMTRSSLNVLQVLEKHRLVSQVFHHIKQIWAKKQARFLTAKGPEVGSLQQVELVAFYSRYHPKQVWCEAFLIPDSWMQKSRKPSKWSIRGD